jgi:predicted nucleic acid-binding protein
MNESISVLARRTEEQDRADDFQNALEYLLNQIPEEMIEWVSKETQRLYQEVVSLVRDTDGELNFHDALIAIRCRELKIKLIFSFDRDFARVEWLYRIGELNDIPSSE